MNLWATDVPWQSVAEAIDSDTFEYRSSPSAMGLYNSSTGDAWNSLQDAETKAFNCPHCSKKTTVAWTSVGLTEPVQTKTLLDAVSYTHLTLPTIYSV